MRSLPIKTKIEYKNLIKNRLENTQRQAAPERHSVGMGKGKGNGKGGRCRHLRAVAVAVAGGCFLSFFLFFLRSPLGPQAKV